MPQFESPGIEATRKILFALGVFKLLTNISVQIHVYNISARIEPVKITGIGIELLYVLTRVYTLISTRLYLAPTIASGHTVGNNNFRIF